MDPIDHAQVWAAIRVAVIQWSLLDLLNLTLLRSDLVPIPFPSLWRQKSPTISFDIYA